MKLYQLIRINNISVCFTVILLFSYNNAYAYLDTYQAECLYNWGERNYPSYISPRGVTSYYSGGAPESWNRDYSSKNNTLWATLYTNRLYLYEISKEFNNDLGWTSDWIRRSGCDISGGNSLAGTWITNQGKKFVISSDGQITGLTLNVSDGFMDHWDAEFTIRMNSDNSFSGNFSDRCHGDFCSTNVKGKFSSSNSVTFHYHASYTLCSSVQCASSGQDGDITASRL